MEQRSHAYSSAIRRATYSPSMETDSAGKLAGPGVGSRGARRGANAGTLDILLSLTMSDLRARYGRGAQRFLKWLLDPFSLVGVYLLLVTIVLSTKGRAPGLSLA